MLHDQKKFPALPARFAELAPTLDGLARQAVDGITVSPERADPMFGAFAQVAGFVRSAVCIEGTVLETGLRAILVHSGAFALLPPEFRLPVIEAAQAAVRNNDNAALSAFRLDPKVYAVEHYTPDIVAVHRETGTAFLLELKRTTASYPRPILDVLEEKMMATALVTRDALLSGRRPLIVSRVEVAIVDCSDKDTRDHVIGLNGFDQLLGCPGVGDSLRYLRASFAASVQSALTALVAPDHGDAGRSFLTDTDSQEFPSENLESELDVEAHGPVTINFARKRQLARTSG
ncbi:hypothetical protein OF122_01475 [Pelagibacterium flavum]|uniref:Uncharacterized protein n=1 Tax=Pelagibacterium flavum TaxID=2984530 RepID=A0ABY6IPH4_9HYPH|nr:hypothetical protein [Pelagibacterium sp. YIM 151497]UYQ72488.1 hypothetical protein OF122_01475 [Pelagibacterium sp. YIM 151497]